MTVYITDGKRFGLSAQHIQMIQDQGISTFDHLHEAFVDGELQDVFVDNEAFILVGQALLEYRRESTNQPKRPQILHLIADAKEFGFTDEMIEKLNRVDIYTILQAIDAINDHKIAELFPDYADRNRVMKAINTASSALAKQLNGLREDLRDDLTSHARHLYRLCQHKPSLN